MRDPNRGEPRVRFKIWIEDNEGVLLSEWRVALLEAIEATGSLARAAERIGVPYRTAWERVRQIEAALGVRLVEAGSGGREGGATRLSPNGRDLVARFRAVTAGLDESVDERFTAHLCDHLR
jgi:molybdate transport system regulatory protein